MSRISNPDLIVGIDFGQTCTGVAYNLPARGSDLVQFIKSWPSFDGKTRDKVPTILYYEALQNTTPSSWGLLTEFDGALNSEGYVAEWFKTMLDWHTFSKRRENGYPIANLSYEDVKRWHVDFLRVLYGCIRETLSEKNPDLEWESAIVEFHFSIPTTWEPIVIQTFLALAREAGFGTCPNHSHDAFLTEPEAVAVHVSTSEAGAFKPGDVVLVCDAGGGTTDLSAFQTSSHGLQRLEQLEPPEGDNIGSALIDGAFERIALEWLDEAHRQRPLLNSSSDYTDLEICAWNMARDREFQNAKCDFGGDMNQPVFSVPIKGLSEHYRLDRPRIAGGRMYFDDADTILGNLFDPVVSRLLNQIDKQLKNLTRKKIDHLILSGGLGQSPYVRKRVEKHCSDVAVEFEHIRGMKIRVAKEPQLAVCKGIVASRLNEIRHDQSIMSQKCCRASYGIICARPYDPAVHLNPSPLPVRMPHDQQYYLKYSVDWLIIKGRPIATDKPIVAKYRTQVVAGVIPQFRFDIATSTEQRPPTQVSKRREVLLDIRGKLTYADWQRYVKEHPDLWQKGHMVEIEMRVVLGSTDLRFELWFDNQKISRDEPISVTWDDGNTGIETILPDSQFLNFLGSSKRQSALQKASASNAQPQRLSGNQPSDKPSEDEGSCCCTCM